MPGQSDWPTPMRNNERTGYSAEDLSPPLSLSWRFQLNGYVWASPVIRNGVVFIPGPGKGLYALSLYTGEEVWRDAEFEKAGRVSASIHEDRLFVCGKQGLNVYEIESGRLQGQILSVGRNSTPCASGDHVFWSDKEGKLNAWSIASERILWSFKTDGPIYAIPCTDGESVFFSSGKSIFAIEIESGEVRWRWQFEKRNSLVNEPVTCWQGIMLASISGLGLYALDAGSGHVKWRHGNSFLTSASITEDQEMVVVADARLHTVSFRTGKGIWTTGKFGFGGSSPVIVGQHIFIGGGLWRYIYAFDIVSGKKVWQFPTGDLVFSTPAYADGRLVIACHDGYVYCFEEADSRA